MLSDIDETMMILELAQPESTLLQDDLNKVYLLAELNNMIFNESFTKMIRLNPKYEY